MKILSFALLLSSLIACQSKHEEENKYEENSIIISGFDIPIPAKTVYLTTMAKKAKIVDSAQVQAGNFRFGIPKDTEPFKACLAYRDSTEKVRMIYFLKSETGQDAMPKRASEYFIVEPNGVTLKGSKQRPEYATVKGDIENQLIFDTTYQKLDAEQAWKGMPLDKRSTDAMTLIDRYPNAYILTEWLYRHRGKFRKQALEKLIKAFKPAIQESSPHIYNLGIYTRHCPDDYDPMGAIALKTKNNLYVTDYTRKRKLNMLMFTTAWSHPSRLLWFYLSTHISDFNSPDLYIVDIGVEEFEKWWRDRPPEVVPWDQLYVPEEDRYIAMDRFDVHSFPVVIFTDNKGNEVARFKGFTREKSIADYKEFIEKNLAER